MLKMYRLKPKIGKRKSFSAASVKEKLYDAALGKNHHWKEHVPESIAKIIEEIGIGILLKNLQIKKMKPQELQV